MYEVNPPFSLRIDVLLAKITGSLKERPLRESCPVGSHGLLLHFVRRLCFGALAAVCATASVLFTLYITFYKQNLCPQVTHSRYPRSHYMIAMELRTCVNG